MHFASPCLWGDLLPLCLFGAYPAACPYPRLIPLHLPVIPHVSPDALPSLLSICFGCSDLLGIIARGWEVLYRWTGNSQGIKVEEMLVVHFH